VFATNHTKAAIYREDCYKTWVHKRADLILEELETQEDD
jgi:hypothetical protein